MRQESVGLHAKMLQNPPQSDFPMAEIRVGLIQ